VRRPADKAMTSVSESIRASSEASCEGLADELGAQVEQHQKGAEI